MILPISLALPFGMLIALLGAILFYVTSYKRIAKMVIGAGLAIAILTFLLILLATNSSM